MKKFVDKLLLVILIVACVTALPIGVFVLWSELAGVGAATKLMEVLNFPLSYDQTMYCGLLLSIVIITSYLLRLKLRGNRKKDEDRNTGDGTDECCKRKVICVTIKRFADKLLLVILIVACVTALPFCVFILWSRFAGVGAAEKLMEALNFPLSYDQTMYCGLLLSIVIITSFLLRKLKVNKKRGEDSDTGGDTDDDTGK